MPPRREHTEEAPMTSDDWLAKVDAAVEAVPGPETSFTPGMPGPETIVPDPAEDPGVREANAMSDDAKSLFRDSLTALLPLAVRLVKLSLDPAKVAHLQAALDAIGFPPILPEGETYTGEDREGKPIDLTVRMGHVYVPPERQKVLDALAEAV